jgi:hypothetical protein
MVFWVMILHNDVVRYRKSLRAMLPEEEASMSLQNVGIIIIQYHNPEDQDLKFHHCEKLKSCLYKFCTELNANVGYVLLFNKKKAPKSLIMHSSIETFVNKTRRWMNNHFYNFTNHVTNTNFSS